MSPIFALRLIASKHITKVFLLLLFCLLTNQAISEQVTQLVNQADDKLANFDAKGYRNQWYRSPTPNHISKGQLISTKQLIDLRHHDKKLLLIDVQPLAFRPELHDFGFDWLPNKPHLSIPGAKWLPNTGYAQLDKQMKDYLSTYIKLLTADNKNTNIVVFCVLNCWLSWNATMRLYDMGYDNVYWYKHGIDGWLETTGELSVILPEPMPKKDLLFK